VRVDTKPRGTPGFNADGPHIHVQPSMDMFPCGGVGPCTPLQPRNNPFWRDDRPLQRLPYIIERPVQ
jgi:hypothetical protein